MSIKDYLILSIIQAVRIWSHDFVTSKFQISLIGMASNQGEVPEAAASPNIQGAESGSPNRSPSSYLNLQQADVTDVAEVIL